MRRAPAIGPMETERALLIAKTMMWAGIIGALLTLLGEFLGWWNEAGEVALTITTIVGAVGGIGVIVIGSSSREVQSVHRALEANGETLGSVDGRLESVDGKLDDLDVIQAELDEQTGAMERQIRVLEQIRDTD